MNDTCRSCHAPVIFVPSVKTGKPMILDAKPEKRVLLEQDDVGPYGITPEQMEPRRGNLVAQVVSVYTDHHVTCPASKDWQGRTRKDPPRQQALA